MSIDDKPRNDRERDIWVQFAAACLGNALPAFIPQDPGDASFRTEYLAKIADAMLAEYRKRA